MINITNWENMAHYAVKDVKSRWGGVSRISIFAIDDTGDEKIIKGDLITEGYAEYLNCLSDGTIMMGLKGWDEVNQTEWHDQDSKIDTIERQDINIFAAWLEDYAQEIDISEAKRYYPQDA